MSPSPYREQIRAALDALVIEAPDAYRWLGRRHRIEPPDAEGEMSLRERLLLQLAERLYDDFYCRGRPAPSRSTPPRPRAAKAEFIETLSRANAGSGMWSSGWVVSGVDGTNIAARRAGLELIVPPDRYRTLDGQDPRRGADVRVQLPKERLSISPGYYVAVGDEELDDRSQPEAVRVYFNVDAGDAHALLASLTRELNRGQIAFHLKVLDEPLLYFRADPVVLIFARTALAAAVEPLRAVVERLRSALRPEVPALTKRIASGVAFANSPPVESFGAHRSRLVAAGALEAFEGGTGDPTGRLDAVEREFQRAGIALDTPYLEPWAAGAVDEMASIEETR